MRLYGDLAPWFHLLTAPEDYAAEAERYRALIQGAVPSSVTLLELGSGGGNNASHLARHFTCTLSDLSPQMLTLSRGLNPACEHVLGDMRTLRLGRTFDAVFVHDAIAYMTTESDLRDCIGTAFATDHVVVLIEPGAEPRVVHDRHLYGLFPEHTWLHLLEAAGFTARVVPGDPTNEDAPQPAFLARRPG